MVGRPDRRKLNVLLSPLDLSVYVGGPALSAQLLNAARL